MGRYAYPLNPTIASTIGCCGIICWKNANHPPADSQQSNPLKTEEVETTAVTVQNN